MRQYHDPDDLDHQDLNDELGRPIYHGDGLSVRELTAEELQRFLDAHADQPALRLGSGWVTLDPPGNPYMDSLTPPGPAPEPPGPHPSLPDELVTGSPGRSALAEYRRRRALELAAWTRSLVWRVPLVAAASVAAGVVAARTGLPWAGLLGLVIAALVGWRLRFRSSEQVRSWQRGAQGERHTAHLMRRLPRDGYVVFHDLAVPGSLANVDHLVIGPTGVFVIDSKQWTGSVCQSADGLAWHNHYRLDRTLETIRWEAEMIGRLLSARTAALLCIHGAHVQGGGLHAQGVAIVPAHLLCDALGPDRVLSDADVAVLATQAWTNLRPAD